MTATLQKKADSLLAQLEPAERVELADLLYASLPGQYQAKVEQAWQREIDHWWDDYQSGLSQPVPAAEFHAGVSQRWHEANAATGKAVWIES